MSSVLGTTCAACGAHRRRKTILYDPRTLEAYCHTPYICNEEHPNSTKNLLQRGSELELVTYEDAQQLLKAALEANLSVGTEADQVRRMVLAPTSIRISDPDLAKFLLDLKKEEGLSSISDAIRYCVWQVMKERERVEKGIEEKKLQNEIQAAVLNTPAPDVKEDDAEEEEITL